MFCKISSMELPITFYRQVQYLPKTSSYKNVCNVPHPVWKTGFYRHVQYLAKSSSYKNVCNVKQETGSLETESLKQEAWNLKCWFNKLSCVIVKTGCVAVRWIIFVLLVVLGSYCSSMCLPPLILIQTEGPHMCGLYYQAIRATAIFVFFFCLQQSMVYPGKVVCFVATT